MSDQSSGTGADSKPWYQSRTIIGAGVTTLSALAGIAGHALPPDLQSQAVELITGTGALIGGALSFWGRLRATRVIG